MNIVCKLTVAFWGRDKKSEW